MRIKKSRGSNLVEYVIPIVLVGIVIGVGLNNFFTNNSLLNYIMSSGNMTLSGDKLVMKNTNDTSTAMISNVTSASSSSGSTSSSSSTNTPNATCSDTDNTCSVDFGDFKLNGIPQNLNKLVETSGTSAGTEAITNILNQIAQQLESEGVEGYQDFKDLANLGFFSTEIIKKSENMFNECESSGTSYSNFYECPVDKLNTVDKSPAPDYVADLLPNYTSTGYIFSYVIDHAANLAKGKSEFDNIGSNYQGELINIEAYERYQKIMDNPNLSQSVKNVAKELYWYLSEISFNHAGLVKALTNRDTSSEVTSSKYDPFTGEKLDTVTFKIDSKEDLLNPKTSLKTNLQDALICAAGANTVIDNSCH